MSPTLSEAVRMRPPTKGGRGFLSSEVSAQTGWTHIDQGKTPNLRNLSAWYVSYL